MSPFSRDLQSKHESHHIQGIRARRPAKNQEAWLQLHPDVSSPSSFHGDDLSLRAVTRMAIMEHAYYACKFEPAACRLLTPNSLRLSGFQLLRYLLALW